MFFHERRAQRADGRLGAVSQEKLIGIGAAVVPDGDRFAAPNQLGAALAEAPPAAKREFTRLAGRRAVPAFHREDTEPIADDASFAVQGARQWSISRFPGLH